MKTPICTFDAKTSILCAICETKLRLGQLTHADVDGAIKITKLAEGSQDVNNFTMLGAYKVDDDFILSLRGSDINILRTHPSVLRKFEDEFQSKVWFVEGQAIGAVLEAFGVHPIIIVIISIIGIIVLIRMIAEVLPF